jgi:hypothetical protein
MIAARLGMTLFEMYRRMSASELCEWMAFLKMETRAATGSIEPTLDERAAAMARTL